MITHYSHYCAIKHNIKNEHSLHVRFEILNVILLKIQVFWVVMSCKVMTNVLKALQSSKMSVPILTYQLTWHNNPGLESSNSLHIYSLVTISYIANAIWIAILKQFFIIFYKIHDQYTLKCEIYNKNVHSI